MKAVDAGIFTKLTGDVTLMAQVTGVFRALAPQEQEGPYVVYSQQSGVDNYVLSTRAYRNLIYLVKVVAASTDSIAAQTASERVDALLTDQVLTLTPFTQMYCRRTSDVEYVETDAGVEYQHVGAMYEIYLR